MLNRREDAHELGGQPGIALGRRLTDRDDPAPPGAGWVSMLLLKGLRNAGQPLGSKHVLPLGWELLLTCCYLKYYGMQKGPTGSTRARGRSVGRQVPLRLQVGPKR